MSAPATAKKSIAADLIAMGHAMKPETRRLLKGITWNEYQELSAAFPDSAKLRMAFHEGTLEVATSSFMRERRKASLSGLVSLFAGEMEIEMTGAGSTTLALESKQCAIEPDCSFYVAHARQMFGCKELDLERYPPPDVVVEVYDDHPSWDKRVIYAQFRVPELWRVVGDDATFYALERNAYQEKENSLSFPVLTPPMLTRFLKESFAVGQTQALRDFGDWLKSHLREACP